MTWVIWDRLVDETFRPDFKALVGEDIPPNPPITLGKKYMHYTENFTHEAIEKIGVLYQGYVMFRMEF